MPLPGFRAPRRLLRSVLASGMACYAGAALVLKVLEPQLVFAHAATRRAEEPTLDPTFRGVSIAGEAGTIDAIVARPDPARDTGRWVLYLHGQAHRLRDPSEQEHVRVLRDLGHPVLAIDYRGFGRSDGEPSEAGLYADARRAWAYLRDSLGADPARTVLLGFSLGSGPATQLATEVPAGGLLLLGAFTSVADRGAADYPWLPVRWMVAHRFENARKLPGVTMPVAIVHALDDRRIPFADAEANLRAAGAGARLFPTRGGHAQGGWIDPTALARALRWLAGEG